MPWVVALLVKGVQLVVDQSQLLGVRHLILLLRVGLTRLLHALAARHRAVDFRDPSGHSGHSVRGVSFAIAKIQEPKRSEPVAIEPKLYMRALALCPCDILIGTASQRGKSERDWFSKLFNRVSLIHFSLRRAQSVSRARELFLASWDIRVTKERDSRFDYRIYSVRGPAEIEDWIEEIQWNTDFSGFYHCIYFARESVWYCFSFPLSFFLPCPSINGNKNGFMSCIQQSYYYYFNSPIYNRDNSLLSNIEGSMNFSRYSFKLIFLF